MKPNCRSQEDSNHLCDYWEFEKTRINKETQVPPIPLEVYHKLYFNAKKHGWLNDYARVEYEKILNHKKEAMTKLTFERTTITTAMEHEIEKEAIRSVCAKEKTTNSAWVVGVGPV
ncbi:hypothetical protein R6Q59_003195 [Mikania micrantha]